MSNKWKAIGLHDDATAEVGQTIRVKAVDENGVSTAWEAVDSQSDWNQLDETQSDAILNKPFGEYKSNILPETTIEVTSNELPIMTEIELIEGNTYTVKWNGVEYTCVAQKWELEGQTFGIVVGDLGIVTTGESTTGEPFFIADFSAEVAADAGGVPTLLGVFDGSASVTVSIHGSNIKQLDNKYLEPFTIVESVNTTELLPEEEVTLLWSSDGCYNSLSTSIVFIPDNKYIVIYDGTEYEVVCQTYTNDSMTITWIGNIGITTPDTSEMTDVEVTDEPFVIYNSTLMDNTQMVTPPTDSQDGSDVTHTVSVYFKENKEVAKLKLECLPEESQLYTIQKDLDVAYISNITSELVEAESALKAGAFVTGTYKSYPVKVLMLSVDRVDEMHKILFSVIAPNYDVSGIYLRIQDEIKKLGESEGDYIPVPATATVGQTIRVSAVDENGVPTAWEAVDMSSGLPSVTTDNNGAFLRVVDGVWAAVTINNAEEATFGV